MTFLILAGLMVLIAAACVAVPLWRARGRPVRAGQLAAATSHKAQLAELDRDLSTGWLAEGDYPSARRDIESEVEGVAATVARKPVADKPLAWQRSFAAGMALLLVLGSALIYWAIGSWRVGVEGVDQASVVAVEEMVQQLSQRLTTTGQNDLQGWVMLGHAYVLMGRYPEAMQAYSHAKTLSRDSDADILAGYAETVYLADPDAFMSEAAPALEKALQLDPRNPQALWYGGLGALQRGDKGLAVQRWQALLAQNPPAAYRDIIGKAIVDAGGSLTAPAASADASAATGVRLHVTLDASLRGKTSPDEVLFVFAEPSGQAAGPPLAVKRFQVRELPLDVLLTDRDAVLPSRKLSDYSDITLTARISASGRPDQHSGDLLGHSTWKRPEKIDKKSAQPVNVNIDEILR